MELQSVDSCRLLLSPRYKARRVTVQKGGHMGPVLLVDTTSVFAFQQFLKKREYPVQGNINYSGLLESVRRRFQGLTFEPMFAFVAINPEHEGQQKFCAFLRNQGFIVDETDFRDAFLIPDKEYPYQRLSTRITYVAGMMAQKYDRQGREQKPPQLVVVTDAFEVYYPLVDYAVNRRGQVSLAFFRRGLEDRWQRAGLFDEDSPLEFCDLSADARAIVGADLGPSIGESKSRSGLSGFQF
jgi:hypothetical protein